MKFSSQENLKKDGKEPKESENNTITHCEGQNDETNQESSLSKNIDVNDYVAIFKKIEQINDTNIKQDECEEVKSKMHRCAVNDCCITKKIEHNTKNCKSHHFVNRENDHSLSTKKYNNHENNQNLFDKFSDKKNSKVKGEKKSKNEKILNVENHENNEGNKHIKYNISKENIDFNKMNEDSNTANNYISKKLIKDDDYIDYKRSSIKDTNFDTAQKIIKNNDSNDSIPLYKKLDDECCQDYIDYDNQKEDSKTYEICEGEKFIGKLDKKNNSKISIDQSIIEYKRRQSHEPRDMLIKDFLENECEKDEISQESNNSTDNLNFKYNCKELEDKKIIKHPLQKQDDEYCKYNNNNKIEAINFDHNDQYYNEIYESNYHRDKKHLENYYNENYRKNVEYQTKKHNLLKKENENFNKKSNNYEKNKFNSLKKDDCAEINLNFKEIDNKTEKYERDNIKFANLSNGYNLIDTKMNHKNEEKKETQDQHQNLTDKYGLREDNGNTNDINNYFASKDDHSPRKNISYNHSKFEFVNGKNPSKDKKLNYNIRPKFEEENKKIRDSSNIFYEKCNGDNFLQEKQDSLYNVTKKNSKSENVDKKIDFNYFYNKASKYSLNIDQGFPKRETTHKMHENMTLPNKETPYYVPEVMQFTPDQKINEIIDVRNEWFLFSLTELRNKHIEDKKNYEESKEGMTIDQQRLNQILLLLEEREYFWIAPETKKPENKQNNVNWNEIIQITEKETEKYRPFKCKVLNCNKKYTSLYGLKYHEKNGHSKILDESKPFACKFKNCTKRYKNMNGLKYHYDNGHK